MDINQIDRNSLERHPLSALFGAVDDFDEMVKDVAKNGLTDGLIILHDGQILDGWHRFKAARSTGQLDKLDFMEVSDYAPDSSPPDFVLSRNVHRRHLSAMQRVDLVVWAHGLEYAKPGRPETLPRGRVLPPAPPAPPTITTREIAEQASVSPRTVERHKAEERHKANERQESETPKTPKAVKAVKTPKPDLQALNEHLQAEYEALANENVELHYKIQNLESRVQANEQSDGIAKELDAVVRSRDRYMRELAEVKRELAEVKRELAEVKRAKLAA